MQTTDLPCDDPATQSPGKWLCLFFYPREWLFRVDWKCQSPQFLWQINRLFQSRVDNKQKWFSKFLLDHAPPNHCAENAEKKVIDARSSHYPVDQKSLRACWWCLDRWRVETYSSLKKCS